MTWTSGPETDKTDEQTALTVAYPGWRFWRTDGGELMATRRRDLTKAEVSAGLALTLPYGHDTDIGDQLAEQARIAKNLEEDS